MIRSEKKNTWGFLEEGLGVFRFFAAKGNKISQGVLVGQKYTTEALLGDWGLAKQRKKICGGNNSDSLRNLQHLCVGTIFWGGW